MLIPLVETLGVLLLAAIGFALGRWFGNLRSRGWVLGFGIPFVLLLLIGSTRRYSRFEFVPPMSWLVSGRTEFALSGFITTMLLATPVVRLPRPSTRKYIYLFMGLIVFSTSVWPFIAPAFNRTFLQSIRTQIDGDGVCRQNSSYTCGPAAAVTGLRHLGFPAEEGELAMLANTSTAIGAPPDLLCAALQNRYASEGLDCTYQHFDSIAALKQQGLTLAIIKFAFFVDHYVAVLEVTDSKVIVGDPFLGKETYTHQDFSEKWRHCGIVLKRK